VVENGDVELRSLSLTNTVLRNYVIHFYQVMYIFISVY